MRNIYKIFGILFFSIVMIISSCKKEDDVPVVNGCTDIDALNYLSDANTNDGSCLYAYDIVQGVWNIETMCQDLTISIPLVGDFPVPLNDMFPEEIEIIGEELGVVSLDINGEKVFADVATDGSITIQEGQTISIDSGIEFVGVVDVNITGAGEIISSTNGSLTLNLSFEVPLAGTQSSSCDITCTR